MIKNFDEVKKQLNELSEIINSFKSEAVQLRIIALILGGAARTEEQVEQQQTEREPAASKTRKRKINKATPKEGTTVSERKKRSLSGSGSIASLISVYESGFFKSPKTIGEIVKHCEVNLARTVKPNEISGKLARMVRNNELKRSKNSDGQYQYTNG